jgi:hypothetical protein
MPQICRAMTIDSGKPLVANTARGLGVRFGNGPNDDMPVDERGNVHPGNGGMSVSPAWRDLEHHRIPRRLKHLMPKATGSNKDACWKMGAGTFEDGLIANGLALEVDSAKHGLVGTVAIVSKETYSLALAATRDAWVIDEE